jgi:hypothetical protein
VIKAELEFFVGVVLGSLAAYLIILLLPNLLLPFRDVSDVLSGNEFSKHYPNKKWIVFLYPLVFLAGAFGSFILMAKTQPFVHFNSGIADVFYFVFWVETGVGITIGLFEVLIGVSALPKGRIPLEDTPFYVKAPFWSHQYLYNPRLVWRTRIIGGLRILLGLFFLFVIFLIGKFSLL